MKKKVKEWLEGIEISLWYYFYDIPHDWYNSVKWAYQRVVRGYDDTFLWNIDESHSILMIKILTQFRNNVVGHPTMIDAKTTEEGEKKWKKILQDMIDGFQASLDADEYLWSNIHSGKFGKDEYKKFDKKFKKGMKLFTKYYGCLWD